MSERGAGPWEIRPWEETDQAALEQFIPSARGGGVESETESRDRELVRAWMHRTAAPGAIVRVLAADGEIHGVVAARRADLVIDGRAVPAFQVMELAVDAQGRGGAIALARDLLSLPHLFYGAANARVERLWRRVGGDRYRAVGQIRVLEIRRSRRVFGSKRVEILPAPDRLRFVPGTRIHCEGAGPPSFAQEEGWLGIGGEAMLNWTLHSSTEGLLLVVRDFRLGRGEETHRDDFLRALRELARRMGAVRTLLPMLAGERTTEFLGLRGVSPAIGWDPGPVLVLHEGSGTVDVSVIEASRAWHCPGWLPL